jgi:hypothetical protein
MDEYGGKKVSRIQNYLLEQQEAGKEPLTEAQEARDVVKDMPDEEKMQKEDPGYIEFLKDLNSCPY